MMSCLLCDTPRDLVPFEQFKKRRNYLWRSVIFCRVTLFHGYFSSFTNRTNGTKSRDASHYEDFGIK